MQNGTSASVIVLPRTHPHRGPVAQSVCHVRPARIRCGRPLLSGASGRAHCLPAAGVGGGGSGGDRSAPATPAPAAVPLRCVFCARLESVPAPGDGTGVGEVGPCVGHAGYASHSSGTAASAGPVGADAVACIVRGAGGSAGTTRHTWSGLSRAAHGGLRRLPLTARAGHRRQPGLAGTRPHTSGLGGYPHST